MRSMGIKDIKVKLLFIYGDKTFLKIYNKTDTDF